MINETDLKGFTGTENYYKDFMGLKLTDGTKFLMDNLKCGWLISDIAVINAMEKKVLDNRAEGNNFLIVNIVIDREHNKLYWTLKEDTGKPILYRQDYNSNSIAENYEGNEITLYLIDYVLLLTSEY